MESEREKTKAHTSGCSPCDEPLQTNNTERPPSVLNLLNEDERLLEMVDEEWGYFVRVPIDPELEEMYQDAMAEALGG